MWKLPDGKVVKFPRQVKIGDVNHPAGIFTKWSKEELATIGIKEYTEDKYDAKHYRVVSFGFVEDKFTVQKEYTVVPRYTILQLKQKLNTEVKAVMLSTYLSLKAQVDFHAEFFPTDLIAQAALESYKDNLKLAYAKMRAEVLAMTDYQEIIDYQWQALMPHEVELG